MTQVMNTQTAAPAGAQAEKSFFLSEVLGAKVVANGRKIGSLTDLVFRENHILPVVTQLLVSLPFGAHTVMPWDTVASIGPKEIIVNADKIKEYKTEPDIKDMLLKDHILDKKAIDLEGHEMEVVYDVKLVLRNNTLYVSEVDLSRTGLLRRAKMNWLAKYIFGQNESVRDQLISWKYIQPLPSDIDRFKGNVQFNILKEKLADMHPVDVADILEEMEPEQRVEVFNQLETEHASDTLEEIDPNIQRDLVESLSAEKVAPLIDDMTTAQAADVLANLPTTDAAIILKLLDPANAAKIRRILDQQEASIMNYATQEYIAFPPDMTVEQAQDAYRTAAKGKDVVMYLYVIDKAGRLHGVLDIKELLLGEDHVLLSDIMVESVVSLDPDSTLKKATELFTRYNFRAVPITDDEYKMRGVVTYRDIMGLKHHLVD
jgi:magnesium transporter